METRRAILEKLESMKRVWIFVFILKLILALSLSTFTASAHSDAAESEELSLPDAGMTPDSPFYGLELALERVQLALTAGKAAKAERGLEYAEERLAEIRAMVEAGKIDAAEKSKREHARILERARSDVKDTESEKIENKRKVEIKKRLLRNEIKVEEVSDGLEIRIRIKEKNRELTEEQRERLHEFLEKLLEENIAFDDIEDEDDDTDTNLSSLRADAAAKKIADAKEEIAEAEKMLASFSEQEIRGLNAAKQLISEAKEKLATAEEAFGQEKYGRAFGQATAAKRLAKNAQRLLEKASKFDEHELKIKAEVDSSAGKSKVKVEARFFLEVESKEELVKEILNRLALSEEQVKDIIKFEEEEDEEEGELEEISERLEIRIKIRDHLARVDFHMRFPLATAEEGKIIAETSKALNALNAKDIAAAIETKERVREAEIERFLERHRRGGVQEEDDDDEEEDEDDDEDNNSSSGGRGRGRDGGRG